MHGTVCSVLSDTVWLYLLYWYTGSLLCYTCIHSNDSVQCKVVNVTVQFELGMPGVLFLREKCMHRDDVAG